MKIFLAALLFSATASAATISKNDITISTNESGTVWSLTFRGKQYVNCVDKGRCFQGAASFDHMGEAFNPTKGGCNSAYGVVHALNCDQPNPSPSSSKLLLEVTGDGIVYNQTQMAFWNQVAGAKLSNHIHGMLIHIGCGAPNVICIHSSFEVPSNEQHSIGQFEVFTGYMPPEFSKFWTVDVNTDGGLRMLTNGPGEQSRPVIFSTPDFQHAIGVYSMPSDCPTGAGYGRWNFAAEQTVKWNYVCRVPHPAGTHRFALRIVVGSVFEVIQAMKTFNPRLALVKT